MSSCREHLREMVHCQKRSDTSSLKGEADESLGNLTAEVHQNGTTNGIGASKENGFHRPSGKEKKSSKATISWEAPPSGDSQKSKVAVAGDWDWSNPRPLSKNSKGVFSVDLPLPPGRHQFKFVIDGQWITSDAYPKCDNGIGEENNYIEI